MDAALHLQAIIGKQASFLSSAILSYTIGRKSQPKAPLLRKIAKVYVDQRASGAKMTGPKLVIEMVVKVDPRIFGAPAFSQG